MKNKVKVSDEIIDSFNTVASLLNVKPEQVVEAVVQLETVHHSRSSFVRWLSSFISSDCETRAIVAEARLAMYAEVDYPAQVRAAQQETRVTNRRIETLTSRLSAKRTALETAQFDTKKVQMLEETLTTNKEKIKDLDHELKIQTLAASQLKEENAKLLDQLELARAKSAATEQTLLDRLDTMIQRQLQLSVSEGSLQTLVGCQKKALTDIHEELTTSKNDHSVIQRELEKTKKNLETLREVHDALDSGLRRAIGSGYFGTAATIRRVTELRDESATVTSALEGVDGDTKIVKIDSLKAFREDLETANKALEDLRKDRDGIYKTLDVSSCLGAHLIIGDLKLARLNLEVLRKAIGSFDDEEVLEEIERLKKRDVGLVEMESALRAIE